MKSVFKTIRTITLGLIVIFLAARSGLAEEALGKVSEKESRSSSIEFESGLVEGMGRARGNFATMTTKRRKQKGDHLYNRWINWDRVMHQSVRESRYSQ